MQPSKRMLWKRDRVARRAKVDKAVACLAASVQSILNDDSVSVENKNLMLRDSFGQCLAHLGEITKSKISLADVAALHRIFDVPRNKNLDVSVGEADDDEGFDNPDADAEDDDENGARHAGDGDGESNESGDQLERARRALKGLNNMQTHSEFMSSVVKKYGITAFCKSVEQGDVRVSEHRLTELISEAAVRSGASFEKLFCAQDECGIVLRKAIAATRDAQFLSRTATLNKVGGSTPHFHAASDDGPRGAPGRATLTPRSSGFSGGGRAQNVDNPRTALEQLRALADEQRKQHKELTEAGAFARVYEDPKNAALVAKERDENRPTAGW
jgi:hypothetical protein